MSSYIHTVVAFMKDNAWIIAVIAIVIAAWSAWLSWRRDVSRFTFRVGYPPSYRIQDGITVTAVYKGGPPLKVVNARARVLRIAGVKWFEGKPQGLPDSAVLKPENREVSVRLDAEYRKHFWYIEVNAEGSARKRKYLRRIPAFWLPKQEFGAMTLDQVGAIATPGELEKSIKAVGRVFRKEAEKRAKELAKSSKSVSAATPALPPASSTAQSASSPPPAAAASPQNASPVPNPKKNPQDPVV